MSDCVCVVGKPVKGARTYAVETALAHAQALARRQGFTAEVYRITDSAKIADVQADGRIDLTWEGSKIA